MQEIRKKVREVGSRLEEILREGGEISGNKAKEVNKLRLHLHAIGEELKEAGLLPRQSYQTIKGFCRRYTPNYSPTILRRVIGTLQPFY